MFKDIGADIKKEDIKFAHRLGAMTDTVATKPRPLRMSLRTLEQRELIFNKARNLPKTRFRNISVVPDLTDMQRDEDSDLMKEAERLNNDMDEDTALNWRYRCMGKRGERVICKMKVRATGSGANLTPLGTNPQRQINQHSLLPSVQESTNSGEELENDNLETDDDPSRKRPHETSSEDMDSDADTDPPRTQSRRANKQNKTKA